jgi:thiamine-monophosphate kinase
VRELDLIRWIAGRADEVGDDCAVLDCAPWGTLLATTDSVIDGVHLHWDREGPAAFACLPRDVTEAQAHALYEGAERAGCRLVGGDTSFGPTATVTVTVLGRAHAKGPVLRSGARPGDWIVVSGPLGGSLESGHHYTFTPRIAEAKALVDACDVGALIDLSDGLSTDLHHVLAASGVGCRLDAARIPLNDVPLANALHDGEDYELLAAVRPGDLPPGLVRIGAITEADAVLVHPDGREEPLVARGYEHGA